MVDPQTMCRTHLLGEHVETHMIVGALRRGKQLGRLLDGFVDTRLVAARHDALAAELTRRGYRHRSPLPAFDDPQLGHVTASAERELRRRCAGCARRTQHDADDGLQHDTWAEHRGER